MRVAPMTHRTLRRLASRYVAETCQFLTENRDVQRVWWPLRYPKRPAPTCEGDGAGLGGRPKAPVGHVEVHVVSLHVDADAAAEIGLAGTCLFLLVPCARGIGMTGAYTRTIIAEAPADEIDDAWPVWMPEAITPRAVPVRLQIAG